MTIHRVSNIGKHTRRVIIERIDTPSRARVEYTLACVIQDESLLETSLAYDMEEEPLLETSFR